MSVYWVGKQIGFNELGEPSYVVCWIKTTKRVTSDRSEAVETLNKLRKSYGHLFNYELFEEEV